MTALGPADEDLIKVAALQRHRAHAHHLLALPRGGFGQIGEL